MASIDLSSVIQQQVALNTQTINSDTTTVGNEIDMQGFESLHFALLAGTVTAGDVTLLVQESDTSGSGFADVDDNFLIGTEADTNISASNGITKIGYVGKKRYVKVSVVTDNSANLTVSCIASLSSPRHTYDV